MIERNSYCLHDFIKMIITPTFVFIHVPKTGGTFVQKSLNQIYGSKFYQPIREDPLQEALKRLKFWETPIAHQLIKHAPCNQIPAEYSALPIAGCVRNPFEWYVSNYKYGWWLSHPEDYPGLKDDPEWPEVSFKHYLELSGTVWLKAIFPNCQLEIGRLSALFILYYCKNPSQVVEAKTYSELVEKVQEDMYPVTFLKTKSLNQDLHHFLLTHGFSENTLSFIKNAKPISPRGNRTQEDSAQSYFDTDLSASIQAKDQLLFDLFPSIS
ncbi:MAG: hypothetical protein AB8G95_04300 [Anaerolineae bacterium]